MVDMIRHRRILLNQRVAVAENGGGESLLLDTYTGAAAAYSLRKLRDAYAGSAIRVRRSSDNAEQDIGFDGNDLDESALTTFVGANDGFVVTWYDQSGGGDDQVQATASKQPSIVDAGSIITLNGKPSLGFGNHELSSSTLVSSDVLGAGYENTTVMVMNEDGSSAQNLWLRFGDSSDYAIFASWDDDEIYYDAGNNTTRRVSGPEPAGWNTGQKLLFANSTGENAKVDANQNNVVSSAVSGSPSLAEVPGLIIGRAAVSGGRGKLQELVIWPSDLLSDQAGIESDVNGRYGTF